MTQTIHDVDLGRMIRGHKRADEPHHPCHTQCYQHGGHRNPHACQKKTGLRRVRHERDQPRGRQSPQQAPASDRLTPSLTNNPNTAARVNPRVFSSATSRVRSRIDIAMVFAETSRVANTTAIQMLRMKALTLPSMAIQSS